MTIETSRQARVAEIDIEVHEDAFQYWGKFDRVKKEIATAVPYRGEWVNDQNDEAKWITAGGRFHTVC